MIFRNYYFARSWKLEFGRALNLFQSLQIQRVRQLGFSFSPEKLLFVTMFVCCGVLYGLN
jgi:hypothetical protein